MDFAHTSDAAPADSRPPVDCMGDPTGHDTHDTEPCQAAQASTRAGIRLRLPPFYILHEGGKRPLGLKSN